MTNNGKELVGVELAEEPGEEREFFGYQLWEENGRYSVDVIGKVQNPAEYGERLECTGGIHQKREVPEHYAWSADDSGDLEAYVFTYEDIDPRSGEKPDAVAELEPVENVELEEKLESAFNDEPVEKV
jgi:hypothetical protein